ncbi:MAG: hypothetical protein U9P72_08300 [Campylobacterota bacterium]|nr:hypothetical protein [Campylobacterota bacterium]
MIVELHQHVVNDLMLIEDSVLRIQIKKVLKKGFYNLATPSPKYPNLYSYKTNTDVEILFIKNKLSILVVSIQQK